MRERIAGAVLEDTSREDWSMGAMASDERNDDTAASPACDREADPVEEWYARADLDALVHNVLEPSSIRDISIHMAEFAAAAGGAGFGVPFVKAIATKAGEDCYQALRNLVRHPEEQSADHEQVRLTDPDTGAVLIYDKPLPDEAIVKLAALKPWKIVNRTITWDASCAEWKVKRKR